jgi:hypothetical protein
MNRPFTKEEIEASDKAAKELWEKTFNNNVNGPWCVRFDGYMDPKQEEIKFHVQNKVDKAVEENDANKGTKMDNKRKDGK